MSAGVNTASGNRRRQWKRPEQAKRDLESVTIRPSTPKPFAKADAALRRYRSELHNIINLKGTEACNAAALPMSGD